MVRINLLPVRVSKKKEAGQQQLALLLVLLAAIVAGNWVWASTRAGDLKVRQQQLAQTKAEIADLERIIGEVNDLKERQKELEEKLKVLARLEAGRTGPVHMLDELATITPRQLWLTKLDEKGGTVSFAGTAVSIDDVSAFMQALKNSKSFKAIELRRTAAVEVQGRADKQVTFEITARAEYATPPDDAAGGPKGKG